MISYENCQFYANQHVSVQKILHCALMNLALDGVKWWTSHPSYFTSWPRARKSLDPALNWTKIPSRPAHSIITILTTLSRLYLLAKSKKVSWPCSELNQNTFSSSPQHHHYIDYNITTPPLYGSECVNGWRMAMSQRACHNTEDHLHYYNLSLTTTSSA